ncbi:hypothetical protein A1O3_03862 [Capronia epimyces CBS 606.96]|uniref:Cardiolipin synthase N-terminal domain-containing protein n=1 Tax=Capronia epimyces CBS 606.96 TaxID=1182542 RepID=W9Y350_9EURO|nr:uncharacterized protein A1O3_03862 [Capronia epimyces CBS 606.96]EXJ86908.1 hypothetical protein A1O3_03862 [Capronia epimyces CBS 606.96]
MQNTLTTILWLYVASLSSAAPLGDGTITINNNAIGYGTGGGIVGLIVLILDILAIVELIQSNRPVSHKLLWALVVLVFPFIGMLLYFFFSNRQAHKSGSSYEPLP